MPILDGSFYLNDNVVTVARLLLGKALFSNFDGQITGGIITETEAYCGRNDKACHANNNCRTKRTDVMYQNGGIAYVYLCYGMHYMLNVVTNVKEMADAVLIRGMIPEKGLEIMEKRRKKSSAVLNGPGIITKALGITNQHNAVSFSSSQLWIEDRPLPTTPISATPRIGVDYAGDDAKLPWRFVLKNPILSLQ